MLKVVNNELYFYDVIGPSYWGYIGSDEVIDALAKLEGQKVVARINSPGGSVDEGIAIYNALRRHKAGVEVVIDSLAASIASVIAMAGDTVTMANGSRMMIHEPWTFAMGNSRELRKQADVLDTYSDAIMDTYTKKTKRKAEDIKPMLAEETWMSAKQAVENGFADYIEGEATEPPAVPKDLFAKPPDDVKIAASMGTRRRDVARLLLNITKARHGLFDK